MRQTQAGMLALSLAASACSSAGAPSDAGPCPLGIMTAIADGGFLCCRTSGQVAVASDAGWACGLPEVPADAGPCLKPEVACGPFCLVAGGDCCDLGAGTYCTAGFTCLDGADAGWVCEGSADEPCPGQVQCGSSCQPAGGGCCDPSNGTYCRPGTTCVRESGGFWACLGE